MERLQKIISQAGICSRRKAERLIEEGKVLVNGQPATIGDSADVEEDTIIVDGHELQKEKKVYLMLHKPKGFITTLDDPFGRASVMELVHIPQRIFPVGRLDRDASGLLLLTNDGDWANRIMHPRYEVRKTYEVLLNRKIERKDIDRINKGIKLNGKHVEARCRRLSGKRVLLTVHTGMNKEVKRIFKTLGYWVVDLKRTAIGPLKLNVKEGKFRHLVQTEVEKF